VVNSAVFATDGYWQSIAEMAIYTVSVPTEGFLQMGGLLPDDDSSTTPVSITVLSVTPVRAGRLFALASVAIDIDGVPIQIHGIRAMHVPPAATRIELPTFRDAAGKSRPTIMLPDEVYGPIGDAVLDELVERGLAVRRPASMSPQPSVGRSAVFPD
jgi:hypothetical protein